MLFLNPWLLLALAGITIPVVIHLVRRQAAKPVAWGAMRFLMDSLAERRRRMEWEDLLLMAARCLLLALAALAVARPFVPPDNPTPWALVLPVVLLGVALFGGSFVLATTRRRLLTRAAALSMLFFAAGMVLMEHQLNLRRFESSDRRDVALIIDASTSMTRRSGSQTLFADALDEARRIVKDAPRGTSFAVILGGPSPRALSNTPLTHRTEVLAQLDNLQALGGTFLAHEALGAATLVLAEGGNPNKDIIVLTDSQRHGWRCADTGAWQALEAAWRAMPAKPRLLLRTFPQAAAVCNAGIAAITTARDLTGTDRPCLLRTEIVNTGNQPVSPGAVLLEIDGQQIASEALGLLVAGQTQTIETRHRFTTPGPHVVTARLSGHDDLTGDDRADHVVMVRRAVRVVIVDGNPSGSFFERAAGPVALALAPTGALAGGGPAGKNFLMDPVVVAAPEVTDEVLAGADVVVLADVARLPAAIAAAVAGRTAAGAGLLVLGGPRAEPAFYNSWLGPDGPLLPLELGAEVVDEVGVSPRSNTFRHPALMWAADEHRSDLGNAVIRRWRKSNIFAGGGTLAAAFSNGEPFLATRGYGRGRCVVATCAFDARAGNLPGRAAFVPLVHELVAWAAGGGVNWNLTPAWSPSVALDSRSSGGLTTRYFRRNQRSGELLLERIETTIDFNWNNKPPATKVDPNNVFINWQATLLPQITGNYLIEAQAIEQISVKIDGKTIVNQPNKKVVPAELVRLTAGQPVTVEVLYEGRGATAIARLLWTPPGGVRQIIPATAWIPASDEPAAVYEAIDPLGHPRKVTLPVGRRGRELRIDGPAVPGLYQVKLPSDLRGVLTGISNSDSVPVVVCGDIAESRVEPLTEADMAQLRTRADVIQPQSLADVLAVLDGRGFGREITRTLVLAALLLLVLETALARWVSRSRRAGDDLRIEFGDATPRTLEKGAWS